MSARGSAPWGARRSWSVPRGYRDRGSRHFVQRGQSRREAKRDVWDVEDSDEDQQASGSNGNYLGSKQDIMTK